MPFETLNQKNFQPNAPALEKAMFDMILDGNFTDALTILPSANSSLTLLAYDFWSKSIHVASSSNTISHERTVYRHLLSLLHLAVIKADDNNQQHQDFVRQLAQIVSSKYDFEISFKKTTSTSETIILSNFGKIEATKSLYITSFEKWPPL